MKKSKYEQMHNEIFELCRREDIKVLSGKISCIETQFNRFCHVAKHFFIFQQDFESLIACFDSSLDKNLYQYKVVRSKGKYRMLTLQRKDMLATSFAQIMKYPDGSYYPSFVFRELVEEDGYFTVMLKKEVKTLSESLLADLSPLDYMGSKLYIPKAKEDYYISLYDKTIEEDRQVSEYQIFQEDIEINCFIKEAWNLGLISEEKKERYKLYSDWVKAEKTPMNKAYKIYQEELLGMKLP